MEKEEIKGLAILRYGNDPNSYGGQRDGFINGYTQCQDTMKKYIEELEGYLSRRDEMIKDLDNQITQLKNKIMKAEEFKNLAITIFENGANAMYRTINVNDGSCNNTELYESLKKESVDYFILQVDKALTQKQNDIDELIEFIDNNALKLGFIAQLKAVKLIQKHTKK